MRFHRVLLYCSLSAWKNSPGAVGKGKTQLTNSSPQSSSTDILHPSATTTDYQSNSQTSPLCNARRKSHPFPPPQKPKKICSSPCLPNVHDHTLLSWTPVPPWASYLSHYLTPDAACLRTAALFHLNVNELPQDCSVVPVSLLSDCHLCYVTEV